MARVELNPAFTAYSGKSGGLVFYTVSGRVYSRKHVVPANPDTENQRFIRRSFADAVKSWQRLSAEEKQQYNKRARKYRKRGYNLYISRYMKDMSRRSAAEYSATINTDNGRTHECSTTAAPMPLRSSSVSASYHLYISSGSPSIHVLPSLYEG